MPLNIYK